MSVIFKVKWTWYVTSMMAWPPLHSPAVASLPLILQTLGEVQSHQDKGHPLLDSEIHADRGCYQG